MRPSPLSAVAVVATGILLWAAYDRGLNAGDVRALMESVEPGPATPLVVVAIYVVCGFLFIPVTVLNALTGLVFGPLAGGPYALLGAVASASATWLAGKQFRAEVLARSTGMAGKLREQLQRRGLIAVIAVRVVPSGPYTLINLVAGAVGIRFLDFVVGTIIGLTPGILVTVWLTHGAAQAIRAATLPDQVGSVATKWLTVGGSPPV